MAAMTVEALIAQLTNLPYDAIVVLAKDAEGNRYSPVPEEEAYSLGKYIAQTTWHGTFLDDEQATEGVRAVCLWPTN